MMFDMRLEKDPVIVFDELVYKGCIEINGEIEYFYAPANYWSQRKYLQSWRHSLLEGMSNNSHAALLTSMRDPKSANFLSYWILYFELDAVYIQSGILFLKEWKSVFSPEVINSYFSEREDVDEDGQKISQWKIDHDSVSCFLNRLGQSLRE